MDGRLHQLQDCGIQEINMCKPDHLQQNILHGVTRQLMHTKLHSATSNNKKTAQPHYDYHYHHLYFSGHFPGKPALVWFSLSFILLLFLEKNLINGNSNTQKKTINLQTIQRIHTSAKPKRFCSMQK